MPPLFIFITDTECLIEPLVRVNFLVRILFFRAQSSCIFASDEQEPACRACKNISACRDDPLFTTAVTASFSRNYYLRSRYFIGPIHVDELIEAFFILYAYSYVECDSSLKSLSPLLRYITHRITVLTFAVQSL